MTISSGTLDKNNHSKSDYLLADEGGFSLSLKYILNIFRNLPRGFGVGECENTCIADDEHSSTRKAPNLYWLHLFVVIEIFLLCFRMLFNIVLKSIHVFLHLPSPQTVPCQPEAHTQL